jgi:hypothetical protein
VALFFRSRDPSSSIKLLVFENPVSSMVYGLNIARCLRNTMENSQRLHGFWRENLCIAAGTLDWTKSGMVK